MCLVRATKMTESPGGCICGGSGLPSKGAKLYLPNQTCKIKLMQSC